MLPKAKIFFLLLLLIGTVNQGKSQVVMCPGSTIAVIHAPIGFMSYSWTPPLTNTFSTSQLTLASLSVTNPVVGSVFTLQATSWSSVIIQYTYAISPSTLNISALASSPSCSNGASGSASVAANGAPVIGFVWLNTTNSVVGTGSVASNLAPGIYSVIASGNPPCGSSTATVLIGATIGNQFFNIYKPYCGNEAYLCGGAGNNYQWYNGTVAIAPPLGTAQCYTMTSPSNGGLIHLKYNSIQGCQDSIRFTLGASAPGNMAITNSTYTCPGSSIGSAIISITPALGWPPGQITYSIFSTGTTTPVFSASLGPVAQNSFGINNLSATTYSVNGFDGSCKYTNTFVIVNFPNNFTLSANSTTLCSAQMAAAGVTFTSPPSPGQYTYSWSPSSLLANSNQQSTIILQNTPSPGLLNTVVFTVVVTPSLINCPLSKTMAITWANPITPSIVPIPTLCSNSPNYTINVTPSGGSFIFMNAPAIHPLTGVLTPSLANMGVNSFVYNNSVGPCIANANATYYIGGPILSVSGNTLVCSGQSRLLFANGANSYTWNTGANSNSISISPTMNTVYSVTGSHTLDLCTSTRTVLVQTINPPSILINGITMLCNPITGTLFATGANTYTWSNATIGNSIVVSPLANTVYTVSGSNVLPNCIGQQTVLVQVNLGPTIQLSGDTLVCIGSPGSIVANGANNYTWSASASAWTNSSNSSTLTVTQAAANIYTLTASSFSNPCITTRTLMVSVFPCTSIEEMVSESLINISPNPSSGIFTIESSTNLEIRVYNSLGQLMLSEKLSSGQQTMDLSEQASGIYFMCYKTNGISRVVRLVKQE